MLNIKISSEDMVRSVSAFDVLQYMDEYELSTLVRDYLGKNLIDNGQQKSVQAMVNVFINHAEEIKAICSQDDIEALIEELSK